MPDHGQGVPEDVGGVFSSLTRIHLCSAIIIIGGHLDELGDVEDEGQDGDGYDVHHHALIVRHGLEIVNKFEEVCTL